MSTSFETIRVAAVHAAAPFLDLDAGVRSAVAFIHEAAAGGARLVAFPETFLPGYPHWIWSHTAKYSAPLFAELFRNAIEFPSPQARTIAAAAQEAGVWVCLGVNEREGGTLYNTMAWFSPEGRLAAKHRKLHPTNAERTIWGRGDGRDVFVIDAGFAKLGGLKNGIGLNEDGSGLYYKRQSASPRGAMDFNDFAIWNRALTADEIKSIYQAARPLSTLAP